MKVSDVDPLVVAGRDLFVVDDVVPGGAIAVHVEPEVVAAKAWKHKGSILDNQIAQLQLMCSE